MAHKDPKTEQYTLQQIETMDNGNGCCNRNDNHADSDDDDGEKHVQNKAQ